MEIRALSPKNVILDLLRAAPVPLPVKGLLEVGALFGFSSNAMRVAVARLVSAGLLESDERGWYGLAQRASAKSDWIERWRQGELRLRRWDNDWLCAFLPHRFAKHHESLWALQTLGFRQGLEGFWVRPDNFSLCIEEVRSQLSGLGLCKEAALCVAQKFSSDLLQQWRALLWPIEESEATARAALIGLNQSKERLHKMPIKEALVESFLRGGQAIRALVLDPLLPDEIAPGETRRALTQAMLRYDVEGRLIWQRFARSNPLAQTPADLSLLLNNPKITGSPMHAEPIRIRELLSPEEISTLGRKSNLRGAYEVAFTWSIIAATFWMVARWPSLWTVLLGLVVLGNRQMALAILQHDGAHQTLMRSKKLNYVLGHWFCGVPNNISMERYWQHHRVHHLEAGTPKDPDLSLVAGYPTTKNILARRFLRDLVGLSSVKRIAAIVLMGVGRLKYTAASEVEWLDTSKRSWREAFSVSLDNLGPIVLWNTLFFLLLWGLGHPWLFGVWWGAYLTTYSIFLRVRSFSEHGCTPGGSNPFQNTRTTLVGLLGRAVWAPHYVNYHLEHHLLMTVPCYRLPALHKILQKKGLLEEACIAKGGYGEVMEAIDRSRLAADGCFVSEGDKERSIYQKRRVVVCS